MARQKLLRIEPQEELNFRLETMRQNSCTIRLSNNSRGDHVAFKVMTTNPEKYRVIPKTGLLLPGSNRDVKVTMRSPEEAPSDVQCKDRFLIKSVAVSPEETAESSRKLFREEGHIVQSCKLRVVYEFPSDIESSLNGTERHSRDGRKAGDLFIKRIIAVVLLCLIFGCFLMPLLWSLSALTMMLVVKVLWKLVSDSVEDWIVNTLIELSVRFFQLFSDVIMINSAKLLSFVETTMMNVVSRQNMRIR